MSTLARLSMLSALLAALGLQACDRARADRLPEGAPNVLLISIDTLRADRLGAYGYARPTTPALDALAARGVVFEDTTASAPWTLPALASLMTAEAVATHGCHSYGSALGDSFVTLAERLLAAGYDTACLVSHIFATTRHGLQQGFVHTDDSFAYPEVDPSQNVSSQVISDKAIRFLDQKKAAPDGQPWFLWLHYFDPHEDYVLHPGISEPFLTGVPRDRPSDLYDGEIRYTDLHVGRVLERLREDGFEARTLVVLVADHGEEFHDHGRMGHGHSVHREVVRVPLVFAAPDLRALRSAEPARQIDVLPTILELAGLPVPTDLGGRSLVPAMLGKPLADVGALSELDNSGLVLDAWRHGALKLIRDATGATRLYDLGADPLETHDLAAERGTDVERLLGELEEAKAAARRRAGRFGASAEVVLTPGAESDLEDLGYAGKESR